MSVVIRVDNLSKQYRLGKVGTGTITHDLNRWWHRFRGYDDPYLKIGEANDRNKKGGSEYVWALRELNFEINQGDAVGIIGRNGAGKSTLLKILSRTTSPTIGQVRMKGRVASLLEVGTGFHPELTGRENIFLNGAILGMTRQEIQRKFDEIVDFSGVERYIDTPVKRYSSGMYVRLAFAVAAHLESEILIVDEVLAVGDAEFQKKCLGKMGDVSNGEGRTILFVSHNMAAIQRLCNKSILMNKGIVEYIGNVSESINAYLENNHGTDVELEKIKIRKGNGLIRFTSGYFINQGKITKNLDSFADITIHLDLQNNSKEELKNVKFEIGINNLFGDRVAWLSSSLLEFTFDASKEFIEFKIIKVPIAPGEYHLNLYCEINKEISDWLEAVMPFTIVEKDYYNSGQVVLKNQGNLILDFKCN